MKFFNLFFLFVFLLISNHGFSLDQSRIVTFFKDYNSQPQKLARLPYAIENGYEDVAEFFVLNGESINYYQIDLGEIGEVRNIFQKHPLVTAIKNGYINLSISMIKLIDNINSINEYKLCYIHTTNSGRCRYDIDKLYALQAAIENPTGYQIVEELIAYGINLNTKYSVTNSSLNNTGSTPLILSISHKKLDVARLLLEHGADANLDFHYIYNNAPPGLSPLCVAVNDNYIEGIYLLLEYGADPIKKPSPRDLSPMELAINRELWNVVDLFLINMNNK